MRELSMRFDLRLPAEIRICREADLEQLEWFGAMRGQRSNIRSAFARQCCGHNWMLVADVQGFPVGQLWIDVCKKPGAALLWAFRILPPFQRCGIGRALLASAEQLIRQLEISHAEVGSSPGTRARCGYTSARATAASAAS